MNIDACVIGVTMARQSVMVNDVEDLDCVQQKQYWAQNTALWNATEDIRDGGLLFVNGNYLGPACDERLDPWQDCAADAERHIKTI